MKKFGIFSMGLAIVTSCLAIGIALGEDGKEAKAKYTIKEIMKIAHKDKLLNKVVDGEASVEEKTKLLDAYLSLLENAPPKGDKESWHELAGPAVVAAAKVVTGRDGAIEELKTSTNCKNCHSKHKPS